MRQPKAEREPRYADPSPMRDIHTRGARTIHVALTITSPWMAMPAGDPPPARPASKDAKPVSSKQARSFFEIPPALKRIFDRFPLVTYAENELPLRAPSRESDEHVLYIFSTAEDVKNGRPSFNPACLKWQVSEYALQFL